MALPERFQLFKKINMTDGLTITKNGFSVNRGSLASIGNARKFVIGFDYDTNEMILAPTEDTDANGYVLNRTNNSVTSSRLGKLWTEKGWRVGHYSATVDGDALIVKLDPAPAEMVSA